MITFDIAGAQINGARDYQEDAFLTTYLGDTNNGGSLIIVADGMGGHAAGNVASNMAVQTFNKHVTSNFPSDSMPAVLEEAVRQANNSISETVRETAALKGMGCTLVGVVLAEKHLRWVSVGDSHLYLIRNNVVKKKNADHSYGGFLDRMATEGSPIEPEAGFSRNMLMSALTGDDIAEIDCPQTPLELQGGDRIIVCSDGLDSLSHGKITAFVKEATTAKECVDALLKGVEEAKMPRQDNTTVVVVYVDEKPETKPVPQPVAAAVAASTAAAVAPEQGAAAPFPVAEEEGKKGAIGLLIGALLLIVFIGGGAGYWYMTTSRPPPAPREPLVAEDEPVVEAEVAAEPADVGVAPAASVEPEPATEAEPEITVPAGTGETFRDTLKSGGRGPLMVRVPAGTFMMGEPMSTASFEERPQHKVSVAEFSVSAYEITIAEYQRFARATGRPVPKTGDLEAADYPVFYVSWNDALAYAKWLSTQTGKKYSLPTEAQWEYAARAGSTAAYWWGRDLGSNNAHCFACDTGLDPRRPTKVGRFDPNRFGVYDTVGNLQEWVYDCWHGNYEGAPTDGGVFEGGDCEYRVVRGGSYTSGPKSLRSSARDRFKYDRGNDQIGFRVVRDP